MTMAVTVKYRKKCEVNTFCFIHLLTELLFAANTLKPRSILNKIHIWSVALSIAIILYNIEKNDS